MADTTFINGTTVIDATWLNDINAIAYKTTYSISLAGLTMHGNVLPNATNTRDLGSSTFRWSNVFTQGLDVAGTSTLAAINASGKLTLTGADSQLVIAPASGSGAIDIKSFSSAGNAALNLYSSSPTTGVRWQFNKNNVAESGSNAGGDFNINRYSDTGTLLGTPFIIYRATGDTYVSSTTASPFTVTGTSAGGALWNRVANSSGSVNSQANLSLDPGNNGPGTRDFSIRAINNGGNQITGSFWTSNAGTPFEVLRIGPAGGVAVVSADATLGYGIGAGGTVTQLTSKSTGVTLNKATGTVVLNNAALGAGASVGFTVTNSLVSANDGILMNFNSVAGTPGAYLAQCSVVFTGGFSVRVTSNSGVSLSEAPVLVFTVIKGTAS